MPWYYHPSTTPPPQAAHYAGHGAHQQYHGVLPFYPAAANYGYANYNVTRSNTYKSCALGFGTAGASSTARQFPVFVRGFVSGSGGALERDRRVSRRGDVVPACQGRRDRAACVWAHAVARDATREHRHSLDLDRTSCPVVVLSRAHVPACTAAQLKDFFFGAIPLKNQRKEKKINNCAVKVAP